MFAALLLVFPSGTHCQAAEPGGPAWYAVNFQETIWFPYPGPRPIDMYATLWV